MNPFRRSLLAGAVLACSSVVQTHAATVQSVDLFEATDSTPAFLQEEATAYQERLQSVAGGALNNTDFQKVVVAQNNTLFALNQDGSVLKRSGDQWQDTGVQAQDIVAVGNSFYALNSEGELAHFRNDTLVRESMYEGDIGAFTYLSYNIAGIPEIINGYDDDLRPTLLGIKTNGFDVAMLQEDFPGINERFQKFDSLVANAAHHPYKTERGSVKFGRIFNDGLNAFSNFPILNNYRKGFPECDNNAADCLATKGIQRIEIEIRPDVRIDILNTHMEAGNNANENRYKARQFDMVAYEMNRRARVDAPSNAQIATGDFNARWIRGVHMGALETMPHIKCIYSLSSNDYYTCSYIYVTS